MSQRLLALLVALALGWVLWRPLLYPAGKAAVLLLDIYSPALLGTNVAELVTPEPLESETREWIGGIDMRVSWWRPAWGDRHPALLLVNGATPLGNDNAATRQFGRSLARAGYLVMLPELPFTKEGRLDPEGPRIVDAAFAFLRDRAETRGEPVGAFGASVGAGVMLVAAGTEPNIASAGYLAVLGGYFDLDTYVASVASQRQGSPAAGLSPWEPSAEAKERIPPAVEAAMTDDSDRARVRAAFAAPTYDAALAELRAISPRGRAILDRLSPSTVWPRITAPIFWIHDPDDTYEPIAEAFAAEDASRPGQLRLVVPRLLQHAAVGTAVQGRDPFFVLRELWGLLTFTLEVLRLAG
ncbi:MAG: hypothetical protein HYX56_05450 [Chloroflexi bacterium]|nr:hypothetical protein [Chloroflexota bacterium]